MAQIIDTKENIRLIYLYIKSFKWLLDIDREMANGHPQEGRLYRGAENTSTHTYRIYYEFDDKNKQVLGIFLPRLRSEDTSGIYTADVIELTLSNILDLNISDQDLDNLLHWLEIDNSDLKKRMWGEEKSKGRMISPEGTPQLSTSQPLSDPLEHLNDEAMMLMTIEYIKKKDAEFGEVVEDLKMLKDFNPAMFSSLARLLFYLMKTESEHNHTPIDPYWIHLDKEMGAGANLSSAVTLLARYGGPDRKSNLEEVDLMGAIKYLLLEQQRRNFHNIK